MATKYNRSDSVHETREARETLYRRQPNFCAGNPKRRLMLIYIGLLAAALLLFFYDQFIAAPREETLPPQRGVAVIVEKIHEETGTPAYTLRLQLETDTNTPLLETAFPEEYWEEVQVSDRIRVIYTESKENGEITLLETGLVALSDGMR